MLVVNQRLPLANHAQRAVVEYDVDNRQIVILLGCQLIAVHAEAAVAGDVQDDLVRMGHLRANRSAQAEAHRAKAAGGEQLTRIIEVEMLNRPHLVLSDVGRDDGILRRELSEGGKHLTGGQMVNRSVVLRFSLEGEDILLPLVVLHAWHTLQQQLQHAPRIADDVVVGLHVLVDFAAVDVNLDDFRVLGEGGGLERHAVGEAAADGDQQIAGVHRHVRRL